MFKKGYTPNTIFFDVDTEFNSLLELKELRKTFDDIPDSHVMIDTINYAEIYTGDRYYCPEDN